jgi:hypothetical protein
MENEPEKEHCVIHPHDALVFHVCCWNYTRSRRRFQRKKITGTGETLLDKLK